jgi:hypothetical protein
MALTKAARSKISSLVQQAKSLLMKEVEEQLQQYYGIRPDGTVLMIEQLTTAESEIIYTAQLLRQRLEYLKANLADKKNQNIEAFRQLVREQAFTILNRFASLRMAEERGIIYETIRKEYNSDGFQIFDDITGQGQTATQYIRYKLYLYAIFDELALDLPSIFDRYSPYALIFPSEQAMNRLLSIINNEDVTYHREEGLQIVNLWKEDETIGWIYQYYNSREEISAMREASGAPRNSQELAVRNQFFTPRYVVQYLTDNSLGRIWYEMTKGNTVLKTVCPYLITQPSEVFLEKGESKPENGNEEAQHVEYRAIKDPREIFMLDPACGSMHFGLYCFDLFEYVYLEAWDFYPELLTDLRNSMTRQVFIQQIPELIIRHNIHGVDIDPRALQIAGLSLWLRAQKSFDKQNLPADQRPRITRSNLVLAEPMPGSVETLSQLVQPLDAPMRKLVLAIWDKMKFAGETGLLLRIEEEIDQTIKDIAKELGDESLKTQLILGGEEIEVKAAEKAALYATKQYRSHFLNSAEAEVVKILQQLSETATNGDAYKKLLFVEDTVRGFAFIELCRKRYDVVLMNPPFGLPTKFSSEYIRKVYKNSYVDLLATFVERGHELSRGFTGAITSRNIFITPKLERIRESVIIPSLLNIVDLGWPVMDNATVQSAAYIISSRKELSKKVYVIDKKGFSQKDSNLSKEVVIENKLTNTYLISREYFYHTPNKKFLYQLPISLLNLISNPNKTFNDIANSKMGLTSFDDFRFLRLFFEVDRTAEDKWYSFAKGGPYSLYFGELPLVINYKNGGIEAQEVNRLVNGQTAQARQSSKFYLIPGGTYSKRSSKEFGVRILPRDYLFAAKGPSITSTKPEEISPLFLIGILNSRFFNILVNLQANADQFDTGIIDKLPIVEVPKSQIVKIEKLVLDVVLALRKYHSYFEPSTEFQKPMILLPINKALEWYSAEYEQLKSKIDMTIDQINTIVDTCYNIDSKLLFEIYNQSQEEAEVEIFDKPLRDFIDPPDKLLITKNIVSFFTGIAFNRYSSENIFQSNVELSDPFENYQLLLVKKTKIDFSEGLIDIYEENELSSKVKSLLIKYLDDIAYNDICEILSVSEIKEYISKFFFADHLVKYTISRREAPIYWPLSTSSGSYTIWIYYPKISDQTIYKLVNDHIIPKQEEVVEQVKMLENNRNLNNKGKKELQDLNDFLYELKEMEKDLLDVAALPFKPNQNDGVLITAAPLHKFFKNSKWRKSTETCWMALEKGEYDWAHLAKSIWPERVKNKCRKDLSLAISHGWEEICEVKPKEKKEKKIANPTKKGIQGKLIEE